MILLLLFFLVYWIWTFFVSTLPGQGHYIHSPEDLILYKLMYFGLSQQSKHSRDIAAILKSKKNELDLGYIEQWAARLGLSSLWLWKEMLDNVS